MSNTEDKTYKMLHRISIFKTAPYSVQFLMFEILSIFNISSVVILKVFPVITEIERKSLHSLMLP